ncbi:hypothetical protein CHCC20327_0541 [Bacillus licheniformis]|nr:hypothetical protein CHCC20327_0541 [Bacillus licheniformis]TWN03213.1 hypothetical protein CHCC14566_1054 [Bacillus licheniformis]
MEVSAGFAAASETAGMNSEPINKPLKMVENAFFLSFLFK